MKKGISLVALIITIIVLIILTAAVVITGINTPQNAQLAVFKNNVSTVQEAVILKMLNNSTDAAVNEQNAETYKWVGVVQGYTYDPTIVPTFSVAINGINTAKLSDVIKENINISEADFDKYYVDSNGVIYYYDIATQKGFEYNGEIYYNATTKVAEVEGVELESIEITTAPNKTTYIEGDIFSTEGMVVTARYIDETTEVISNYTINPNIALTIEDTEVIINYGGKTATQAITVNVNTTGLNSSGTTLGEIIRDANAYGTSVNGYTAGVTGNEVSDWSVFYKQTVEEEEYVYLITSNVLSQAQIPSITTTSVTVYNGFGALYWNSTPALQTMNSNILFMANFGDYGTYENGKCASVLLNTSNWSIFATSINTNIAEYVEAAIGSPTAEMWTSSWTAKGNTSLSLVLGTYGYTYNYNGIVDANHYGLETTNNELYFPNYPSASVTRYWFASPFNDQNSICMVTSEGGVDHSGVYISVYDSIRPVVCIHSDIPASVSEGVITLNP